MKTNLRILGLSAVFAVGVAVADAQNRVFTNQYSFGDSLSDNGNAFAASGGTVNATAPNFGGRWSNGRTFVELLGNTLAVGATAPTSVKSSMGFAFGGASAVPSVSAVPFPSVAGQIQLFQSHAVSVQKTDLFTVWIGANDILNTVSRAPSNPSLMDSAGIGASQVAGSALQTLIGLGAKNILVLNMPDIGLTPFGQSTGVGSLLTRGSMAYNADFDIRLGAIAAAAPDVNITRIDAAALIERIQRDYKLLGFSNASAGLTSPASAGGGGDANGYVFFDGIHPTARTHALLAQVVLEALNPEPVLGFAGTLGSASLALQDLGAAALDDRTSQLAFSARPVGRADAFASFNYGDANRRSDSWRPKFKHRAQVLTAGVDVRLSDGFFVGGAVNGGRLNATVSGEAGDFTVEDATGRVFGVWRGGPVSLLLDADYGNLTLKGIHRRTAFGGFAANGKTSGQHWGVGLKAAWVVDVMGTSLRPWLGLRTERVKLEAFQEKDIPALAMDYSEQEAQSKSGAIGVDTATSWKFAGLTLRLDLRAAWHGEIGSESRYVTGRLANNFTHLTSVELEDGNGSGIELGGATTLYFAKNWSATLGYKGDIRPNDRLASRATLSFQTGF